MKKFLLKVFFIFIFYLVCFLGLFLIYGIQLNSTSFKLGNNEKHLFVGDSHIEVGINEKIIPYSFNFAHSGDPYINQYARIAKVLKDNPQLKTIFITVTPISISEYSNSSVVLNSGFIQYQIPYSLPFYKKNDLIFYFLNSPKNFLSSCIFTWPRKSLELAMPTSKEIVMSRLGGRLDSDKKNLFKHISELEKSQIAKKKTGSDLQLKYLVKIVNLANQKKVRLIFLNTPIYKAEKYFDLPFFYKTLQREFPDVEFWDYMNWECPDDYRQDINHLNKWGAEAFSKEIAERMKREGLLE